MISTRILESIFRERVACASQPTRKREGREVQTCSFPSGEVWVGVDFGVSCNIICGRFVWGIASDRSGAVVSLIHPDVVYPEVIWEDQVAKVDILEVV